MSQYWWVYIKDVGPGNYRARQNHRCEQFREINAQFPHFSGEQFATEKEADTRKRQINYHFPHIPLEVLPGIDP
jgi:hypothetical protein